jgi:hypothetical protein
VDSEATAATIDLDDEDASAPLLNHISELVEDIIQKASVDHTGGVQGKMSNLCFSLTFHTYVFCL